MKVKIKKKNKKIIKTKIKRKKNKFIILFFTYNKI